MENKRLCIIGSGPSGMSAMIAFSKARAAGESIPEIVCYEKQSSPGGLWNYSWRTGLNAHGEPVHNSMYKQLFSNTPKECIEMADYTFQDHFGKPVGSYPPRESLFNYIMTRFRQHQCEEWLRCNTSVKMVSWDEAAKKFTVVTRALESGVEATEQFDYVTVACGHFSTPHLPNIKGFDSFQGRVVHAHDVRNAQEFKNQRVLVVGSSFSAEDIGSMAWKNGAAEVVISMRDPSTWSYTWPAHISSKCLLTEVAGDTISFQDGSQADFDTIVMATGYQHSQPFMEKSIRLVTPNLPYPSGLYKCIFWQANPQLMYLGMPNQAYTLPMFDAQAYYAKEVVLGKIALPSLEVRQADIDAWKVKESEIAGPNGFVNFQGKYIADLNNASDYQKWDIESVNKLFLAWAGDKRAGIMTFRDKSHTSVHTGIKTPIPKVKWVDQFDFSDEAFRVNQE